MDRNYKKVAEGVVEMTGVDIFLNTRQRNYVELRALVCYILREKLGMRWTNIAYYFESMGKTMNHATVIHLVKNYETYKMYNKSLQEIEDTFNFKSELNYDEIDKIHYLQGKCDNFERKYLDLRNKVKNDPIMNVLHDIPKDKLNEIIEKVSLWKQSWNWKNKDECKVIESSTSMEGMHWQDMIYKNYEIMEYQNGWGYYEAVNLNDCDDKILFANTIEKLKIEIDELK